MAREILQFSDIFFNFSRNPGQLRLANSGVGWKSEENEHAPFTFAGSDLRKAVWSKGCRGFNLKFHLLHGSQLIFEGFNQEDSKVIEEFLSKNFELDLQVKEQALKGWNWGDFRVNEGSVSFESNGKTDFEIPLSHIVNSNFSGKHEISLEVDMQKPDNLSLASLDELVEVRVYVPDAVGETEEQKEEIESRAQQIYDTLKSSIETREAIGEAIVIFTEVFFTTPRGRYDVEMYPDFLRLRGKTYDYKLQYSAVTKMFLLPKSDEIHIYFIVSMDPPLRQGQTRYPFLVMQFARDEEMEVELNILEEDLAKKYSDRLEMKYDAAAFKVVSQIFKGLTDKRINLPGTFASHNNQPSVKCSFKASEGQLFLLEKCMLFVPKPTIYMEFNEIESVIFQRLGMGVTSNKTFDVVFKLRSGAENSFSSVSREDQPAIEIFLKSKSIRVHDETLDMANAQLIEDTLDNISDVDEDDDADIDRGSAEDDSESPDEDFEDESESDPAEEYDENASISAEDSEEEEQEGGSDQVRPMKKQKV